MNGPTYRTQRQTMWVAPLLALLVTALFLEGLPVIHVHLDGEPGFYNAACSLSLLATPSSAPLPEPELPDSRFPELPVPIEIAESAPPSATVLGSASRAPPVI